MLRFIICEDNKEYINEISIIINKVMMPYNFEYKINKYREYNKEVEEIIVRKNEQKIYILDIELPEVSGLEIASNIREVDLESIIIFVTSHPECQNDIFYSRLLVIDYINKNQLWKDRLSKTIKYAVKNINNRRTLSFDYNHNSYRLSIKDILYIEKLPENQKCVIVMEDGNKYEIISSITKLKDRLGANFYQSHKSCLVNVEKIKRINYPEGSITFQDNQTLYLLSHRNKKGLKEYVANY
ncbi:MAG: response regulator transcription factor [Bacilli bacterium]|nr:response regulator transcription factor [Bacilli bacterium]